MSELIQGIQDAWDLFVSSISDPASNPVAALLGLAVVTLVLLIVLIALYLAVTHPSRKDRARAFEAAVPARQPPLVGDAAPGRRKHRLITGVLVIALAAAGLVVASAYTSTDRFCAECHYTERAFESRSETAHKGVSCSDCHEGGSASDYLHSKARGVKNSGVQFLGLANEGPVFAAVSDAACLSCHDDLGSGSIIARSIKVSHSEILAAGYHCTECHNTEGHGREVLRPKYPEMRYCIICHDGTKASSDCESCHAVDPGAAVRRSRRVFPKTDVRREDCRGCHSMQSCIDCHGLELPHSREFVEGYHALKAYTELETCLSCHDLYAFCTGIGCHNFAREGIVSKDGLRRVGEQHRSWAVFHGQPASNCAGCHGDPNVCQYCHGEQPEH